MLVSYDAKLYIKYALVSLLGGMAAMLGTISVGLFGDYYRANPYYNPIPLTRSVGIDLFGAVAPVFTGLFCVVLLLVWSKFPLKKFGVAMALSVVFAFSFSFVTTEGLAGYPMLFAVVVASAAAALTFYKSSHVRVRRKIFNCTILVLCCAPLSLFVADLVYAPTFERAIIGGGGLTDGVLLATLYSPFAVAAIVSAALYISQTVLLIKKNRAHSKKAADLSLQTHSQVSLK